MNKLQQLKDEAREEFNDIKSDILSRMGEDKGSIHCFAPKHIQEMIDSRLSEDQIRELNDEINEYIDFIDSLITKAYEAGKKEAIEAISREEGWEESQEYYEGKLLNKE